MATRVAYVQQEEIFYSMMTVRETLELIATLRLPKRLTAAERAAVVDSAIARLGLDKCQHTAVRPTASDSLFCSLSPRGSLEGASLVPRL